jgi:hypothetical protein
MITHHTLANRSTEFEIEAGWKIIYSKVQQIDVALDPCVR